MKVGIRKGVLPEAEFKEFCSDFKEYEFGSIVYGTKTLVEQALISKEVEISVGSAKDSISNLGILELALSDSLDPNYALISRLGLKLNELPVGSEIIIPTDRLSDEILRMNPGVKTKKSKGPVLEKIQSLNKADSIIVANAALIRLGLQDMATEIFTNKDFTINEKQGKLSIKVLRDNFPIIERLRCMLASNKRWKISEN